MTKTKPIATPNELREHFLEQIKNGERLTFTSSDANKIIIKARQNETLFKRNRTSNYNADNSVDNPVNNFKDYN